MRERVYAGVVSLVLVVLVCYPVAWEPPRDSFPLSSYPMFARSETSPVKSLRYAVGIEEDGTRRYLSPEVVANSEVLQARAVIERAFARGAPALRALCRRIADRVAEGGSELNQVAEIHLVAGTHDAVAFLVRGERGEERVHHRCRVEGR